MEKELKIAVVLSAYDHMTTAVARAVGATQAKLTGLQKFGKGLGHFGTEAMLAGGIGTAYFLHTVELAEAAEVSVRRLNQAFVNSGDTTGEAAKKAEEYAEKLSMVIGKHTEEIEAVQAKLAIQKSIASEQARAAGIFDAATLLTYNMEAAGFGEASMNAQKLGKMLENPVKGIQAFSRAGVVFKDNEIAKVKGLMATNHQLDAQKYLMGALQSKFHDMAEKTAPATKKLEAGWHALEVRIGTKLLPVVDALATKLSKDVIPAVSDFLDKHGKSIGIIAALFAGGLGLGVIAKLASFAISGFTGLFNVLKSITLFMVANPIFAIIAALAVAAYLIYDNWDTLGPYFKALWDGICQGFEDAWIVIRGILWDYQPWGLIYNHWSEITGWFSKLWKGVTTVFSAVWKVIKAVLWTYTPQGLIYDHWNGITSYFSGLWDKVENIFSDVWHWLSGITERWFNAGKAWASSLWDGFKDGLSKFFHLDDISNAMTRSLDLAAGIHTNIAKSNTLQSAFAYAQPANNIANRIQQSSAFQPTNGFSNNYQQPAILHPKPLANNSNQITNHFAPVVNLYGAATEQDGQAVMRGMQPDYLKMLEKGNERQKRIGY